MTIRVVCPGCRATYQVADSLLGKKIRCRGCEQPVVVAAAPPRPQKEPAAEAEPRPPAKPAPRPRAEEVVPEEEVKRSPAPPPRPKEPEPAEEEVPSVLPASRDDSDEDAGRDRKERRRPARRRDDDEDDDDAPRPAPKKRRPKGHLTAMQTFAATLAILVILAVGGLGAYFVYVYHYGAQGGPIGRVDPPMGGAPFGGPPFGGPPFGGPPPGGMEQRAIMERQAQLEAFFRMPEEPAINGMEFTEPPGAREEKPPKPVQNNTGQLTPEVLQKIKDATVYLRVKSSQGEAEGSGFFGVEPGFILTNAHVVGMLERHAPPPTSVRVVRNKGEKNETSFPAQVVAVDRDADLAVLSVKKEGMPEPLVVKSAGHLQETQAVYVAGFPLGEIPGKSITINKYELSSLKKEKGVLDKLQVHGDMLPGNSGGPLLDGDGDVVGVCVAILRNTRINFAIPGDKVWRFLNGRLTELTLEPPTRADDQLRVPVAVRLADPLGRVRQTGLDFWIGKPGPARPGSWALPEAQPGETPRQTLALDVQQQVGRGELALAPLPAGQVYWLQPSLVNNAGAKVWLSAQMYRPPPPVDRKPARLAFRPAGDTRMLFERLSSLQFPDPQGRDHRALVALETHWTDTARGTQGADVSVSRQFTGFKEGVTIDGEVYMTTRLQHLGPNIGLVAENLSLDTQGATKRDQMDPKWNNAPTPLAKRSLIEFQEKTRKFLQGLEVPLPAEQLQPGQTWKARRPLPIDATWQTLQVLPAQIWGTVENESLEVTYTYTGTRTVNGVEQAVIHLNGQVAQQPGQTHSSGGRLSGTAVVDLATGQIVEEEVTTQENIELVLLNTVALKAQGVVLARLRRE